MDNLGNHDVSNLVYGCHNIHVCSEFNADRTGNHFGRGARDLGPQVEVAGPGQSGNADDQAAQRYRVEVQFWPLLGFAGEEGRFDLSFDARTILDCKVPAVASAAAAIGPPVVEPRMLGSTALQAGRPIETRGLVPGGCSGLFAGRGAPKR
jgi:hypothetical protein